MEKILENKIYLCYQKKRNSNNYECFAFENYNQADEFHKKTNGFNKYINSFMIPISWYIPNYFHQNILHQYISKKLIQINMN